MPKLSDINIDASRFKGKGLRPWIDNKVVYPNKEKSIDDSIEQSVPQEQDKRVTNGKQKDDKRVTNRVPNGKQKGDKRVTLPIQKGDKWGTKQVTNRVPNGKQKGDKRVTFFSYSSLIGLQKKSITLIFELTKMSPDKNSVPISLKYLSERLGTSINSMKQTMARLKKKNFLVSTETRCGRGGWAKYQIEHQIYQEILLQAELEENALNGKQKGDKWGTKWGTERVTNPSSSSGINNYLNTTTTSEEKNEGFIGLDEEWSKIDFEPLANIGFTETHLKQIASQGLLKSNIVQDSIHAFSFDLENNGKEKTIKGQPLNYFMGILRKGQPYAPPENYESPKVRLMRLYVERMRKEEEKKIKLQKEMEDLAFNDWFFKLTDDEVKKLLPGGVNIASDRAMKDSPMVRGAAHNYFKENVWTDLKETIENSEE